MPGSHVIRYDRLRRGEYYADIRRDERLTPEVYHCVIQRDGSSDILAWSQFRSLDEAIESAEAHLKRVSVYQLKSVV